ncbi:MAG: diguanylate cyclase, partial [Gammaproteobacteria bacterium]|nr:diguanylate cyclase [Gammaproteobacteria bacterium]
MQTDLRRIRNRFTMMVVCSFILTPFAGLWAAILFGSATWPAIRDVAAQGVLPLFLIGMTLWVAFHFWRFLNPVLAWLEQHPASETGPAHLCRRLARFPRDYWGLFACYVLAVPVIYFWSSGAPLRHGDYGALSNFLILQLSVATLIGLPAYLSAQDRLGKLAAYLGLERVQFSLKSRLMLLGGFVPLLSYSILTHYYWLRTGYISSQTWIVWGTLALITVAVTLLSIHSLAGALRPVQEVLGRSGAATHEELAELRPQSTDEIGYLTQTLGKLFRRLRDQESHMHAIVDTAAEGIIVADSGGLIDTFNAAAERLFGYNAQEIRGRPLAWLLPTLVADGGAPNPARGEQEVEGVHRSGRRIPMSVRASEMSISGKRMFTLLVGDISERKAAEQKLTNAELRYRELVETAHDLVWSLDPQWRWTYLNSAATTIYGYPPEEMLGRSFTDFEAPEYAQQATTAFASLLQGNELVQYETVHLDREGNPHYLSFNARVHTDERGNVIRISGTARDITEQKAFERRLAYQAEHDSLTGLYNRNYFQHELERVVARIARSGAECALLYIDIDQFKYINDTLGHAAGDRLLIEISNLLDTHVREGDLLARFGGDEFTVLLYNIEPDRVPQVAENFRLLFERFKFLSAGNSFNITCSIGVSNIDNTVHSAEEVLSHADLACNIAKAHGRNRVNLYNPADRDKVGMAEDMGWAARVREMLEQDRFLLVYQPIVSIADGSVHE